VGINKLLNIPTVVLCDSQ